MIKKDIFRPWRDLEAFDRHLTRQECACFLWEKLENAKMAAVIADVFRHLVVRLREVHDATVSVPPVDKVINDLVLVFFANQIVKNNDFLVVNR